MSANPALPPGKPASLFLSLPPEVRDCIYNAGLDWPDISDLAKTVSSQPDVTVIHEHSVHPLCTMPIPRCGSMSTPSLLLLNRQITSEALEVLYRKPLILDKPPPYMPQLGRPMDVPELISENTLQNLRFIVLRMDLDQKRSARDWLKVIEILIDIWLVKNDLKKVQIHVQYTLRSENVGSTFAEAVHHQYVRRILSKLRGFGEQFPVIIEGVFDEEKMGRGLIQVPGRLFAVTD
ncbi:hypothetical protein N431DRAFT_341644 [Stipitochalara longipes BDJ]|nr:hypothetical protein N431DRAFT_341644 [Stipitochalara longipes BDJ]